MRRAAREMGNIVLSAHPEVIAAIRPAWIEMLVREVGGAVDLRADPALTMSGGHASRR
jgi:hypothetical protein